MRESYIPITIYPPEGDRFVICTECGNPCVVGIEEDRNKCLMCLLMKEEKDS